MQVVSDELDKVTNSLCSVKRPVILVIVHTLQVIANSNSALRLWMEQSFASKEDVEVGHSL